MKGCSILLDHLGGREAAALVKDGQLEDFLIATDGVAPGTVYLAKADRPVKGQGGMFLKTPDGPVFLRQIKGLAPGDLLRVQVSGFPEPGKAMPVTAKLLFKSRYAIVTPQSPGQNISRAIRDQDIREELSALAADAMGDNDFGLILRSSCAEAHPDDIRDDIENMLSLASQVMADTGREPAKLLDGDQPHGVAWRDWAEPADVRTDPGCFGDSGVSDLLVQMRDGPIKLPGGGYLFVEPTRALVAVDVNTGADTSLAAGTKANVEAARTLPRVLRVLGLGGQIVLDLAPMPKKDRQVFEQILRAALRSDSEETNFAGWTPLGNVELQRKRGRAPLAELLLDI